MDCDTTGVEPDFALVKFKKLAGGGYFKIVNQSVPAALKNLGYTQVQTDEIIRYVLGAMNLKGTPHVNAEWLKAKGLTDAEIAKIEKTLPGTFELSSAFSKFTMGDEMLKRLGVSAEQLAKPTFNFLTWAGLTQKQLAEANEAICGTMTVEGAPHLKDEHLAVFDCANKCGVKGQRFIAPMGHIKMMGATQPFLSGAISKTVNVPNETTVEEIQDIYYQGWKLGLKAVALYRDGCKLSQPLSTKSETKSDAKADGAKADAVVASAVAAAPALAGKAVEQAPAPVAVAAAASVAPVGSQMTFAPVRRKLPAKRTGFTQEAEIAGHKVYLRTGEYADGTLGELFIDMHKEGAAYRSMMNCFAISVSLGLQYGVPLSEFVDKFTFTRFEPSGMVTGHPNIKLSTSIVDYIFRVVGMEYLGRTDFVQVKPVVDTSADKGAAALGPKQPSKLIAAGVPLMGSTPQMEMKMEMNLPGAGTAVGGASGSHLAQMMGDAPPCDGCGHTTVRNGACYKCLNCGNSMGCS
jgi:ribonucleoside-diphosphate reductase alpha chain